MDAHIPLENHHSHIVGVDGAKRGWLAVWHNGSQFSFAKYDTPGALLAEHHLAEVIAVDVPIGLSDRGPRVPDQLARRFVGSKRASSIFSAPVRGILDAQSQSEASSRHRAIDGRGYGAQSFAILPYIRAWDVVLRQTAAAREKVYEIHPEVCFAALNDGIGIASSKKSRDGAYQRAELLCREFGSDAVSDLVERIPSRVAAPDDVLDALVALWSARRIADGGAKSLPESPIVDSEGLRIAIFY